MINQADSGMPWPTVLDEAPTLNEVRNLPNVFARVSLDFHKITGMDGHSVDAILPTARGAHSDARVVIHTRRSCAMGSVYPLSVGYRAAFA